MYSTAVYAERVGPRIQREQSWGTSIAAASVALEANHAGGSTHTKAEVNTPALSFLYIPVFGQAYSH